MKSNSVRQVRVEGGGGGLVAHVGLHALGAFADCLGVGASLSAAVPPAGERAPIHDRGKVLTQAMLMLAGGGEACTDIEYLRAEVGLFGAVASAPTLYRTLRSLDPATVEGLWAAQAAVREQIWARRAPGDAAVAVVLDIDATLVEIHSEHKAGAAAHYKGGYGFHPLLCFSDDGDALAAVLRPGNAAANNIDDHIAVLDAAIGRLPAEVAAGHRPGDDAAAVAPPGGVAHRLGGLLGPHRRSLPGPQRGIFPGGAPQRRHRRGHRRGARHRQALAARDPPKRRRAPRRGGRGPHRLRRCRRLARRDAPDRAPRTPPPRRATLVVPQRRLALLGPLDRPRRPRRHPRRAHARPRRRRGPHRRPQRRRPQPPALRGLRRQRRLGRARLLGAHPRRVVSNNSPAAPPLSSKPPPNGSAGRCGTPPDASSAPGAARPSAYPTTTPAQRTSPASTTTSPPSPESPPEGTKTSQPPQRTTRRANLTRPHTNHKPETTPHQPPNPQSNTPPAPNTPPKDPTNNRTTPQTILMNNQG